jgi:hypothetical protein
MISTRKNSLTGSILRSSVSNHLAGHTNKGTHLLDTHNDHVIDDVWELYRYAFQRTGGRNTLLEWDEDIPEFDVVHEEALKAKDYRTGTTDPRESKPHRPTVAPKMRLTPVEKNELVNSMSKKL